MGTYDGARARTKAAIETAFWNAYIEKGLRRVTVQEIAERAGVHRATFYMHYDSIDMVLDSIKARQIEQLNDVLSAPRSPDHDYEVFLCALQRHFEDNRTYLEPLVCDYTDNEFAFRYREILKNELRKDIDLPLYPQGTKEYFAIDTILSAFIETLLQTLRTGILPLREAYRMVSGCVNRGVLDTLREEFAITSPY